MRKLFFVFLLSLAVQSCDTFRRMAGRPTSDEIQAKRELIAAERCAEQARQSELESQRRLDVDSLRAMAEIQRLGIEIRGSEDVADTAQLLPGYRFYIIIGAFRSKYNVERVVKMVQACGFTAVKLKFSNGFTSVGVSPTCNISDCLAEYEKVSILPFCPDNSWILDVLQ